MVPLIITGLGMIGKIGMEMQDRRRDKMTKEDREFHDKCKKIGDFMYSLSVPGKFDDIKRAILNS